METKDFKMKNLKNLRRNKHLSQIGLSMKVEVSQELISQYELGKSLPSTSNLIKLADYFHCSTDYLLGRTNDPSPIKSLNDSNLENLNIINKYNSLTIKQKKDFNTFLDYLCNCTTKE